MTVTFNKAPLVEVVAELKWGDAGSQPPATALMLVSNRPDTETFFVRLGGELYQHGFRRVERVVPAGFPTLPFQPVYRYRGDTDAISSISFQAGPGLFVMNAIPPYRSWEQVEPILEKGVLALLNVRDGREVEKPLTLSLRYINGFGPDLTGRQDVGTFISEVFGFRIDYPASLLTHLRAGAKIEPYLQLSVPLEHGATLTALIAHGTIGSDPRLIVDFLVNSAPVTPHVKAVISSFQSARKVIHDIFVDWTMPIHDLLDPVEND